MLLSIKSAAVWGASHNWLDVQKGRLKNEGENPVPHCWKHETTVLAGDIVIQRGTNQGWANRSNENCRIVFVLVDGQFSADLQNL